jgi:ketosteroid isomerase-like protein
MGVVNDDHGELAARLRAALVANDLAALGELMADDVTWATSMILANAALATKCSRPSRGCATRACAATSTS